MLACLINFRFNAVPQELAGGNISPMRKTAGQKAAATRKRNAARRQAAAKKAASTRKSRAAGKKAAVTRKHRAAGRKAAATRTRRASARKAAATRSRKKEAAPVQPLQVQSRPHQSPRYRPHPKPPSPSKLGQASKASAHERRLVPFHRKKAFHCTNLGQLTEAAFRRTFASKEYPP